MTAEVLAQRIARAGGRTPEYASSFNEATEKIATLAQPGDMVLTMGAGSVSQLGPIILEKLERTR